MNAPGHTIHARHRHYSWDRDHDPVLRIAPGETVELQCLDAADGQITPDSSPGIAARLDPARVNPVTGPLAIEGARPGDAVVVRIRDCRPAGWGWTANIPGFGLLADSFPDAALNLWSFDPDTLAPAAFGPQARVPLKPFIGTIGTAPAAPGPHPMIPPLRTGGNMDIRDLGAGVELWLPVAVEDALVSVGDTHAAQGDGEVCGTAIECPMEVVLDVDLVREARLPTPRFVTPGPVTRHLDGAGYWVTTGIGADVMAAARDAVSAMIDLLCAEQGMAAVDAYMLCSVCADLRLSEVVDDPNRVVSFYFPRCVFS